MDLELRETHVRKIVNVHKHVDGPWFWGKYTAHPYVGCRSGCTFCYLRGGRYLGRRDPDTFDSVIQVKMNSVELLRAELGRLDREVITCGDWQRPAEDQYQLSRGMLQVVLELEFPLFIVERSPLLLRDLDLLVEINRRSWVSILYSISGLDPTLKRVFEPHSPGVRQRLRAVEQLADAGITTGVAMMPIIPLVGDGREQIEDMVLTTRDHGGSCVLGGGMTMEGAQANWTLSAARKLDPALEARWRALYGWETGGKPNFGPPGAYNARLGLLLREACARHGLSDHLPRYIAPGPLAANKRIAERLFLMTYDLELEEAQAYRIWAYRKAAWTVDECSQSVVEILQQRGEAGLRELPGVGARIAAKIAGWIREEDLV